MTEQIAEPTDEGNEPTPPRPSSLEDLLADLDDDRKTAVLGEVRKARNEAKSLRVRLQDALPKAQQFDALDASTKTEQQRAEAAIAAAAKATQAANARAVKAEVKALAASEFADPEDAFAFLDHASYVDAAGDIDTQQIKADLAELLARKPHLGKAPSTRRPQPDRTQGSGARGASPIEPRDQFAAWLRQPQG